MYTFSDNKGRSWSVRLDVGKLRLLREKMGLSYSALIDMILGGMFDPLQLVDVLSVLLRSQIEHARISVADFEAGLDGDVIGTAGEVLYDAVVDFFPQARLRQQLRETRAKAVERAIQGIQKVQDGAAVPAPSNASSAN